MNVKLIENENTELEVGKKYIIITCEDDYDFETHKDAFKNRCIVESIWEKLFRPRHKHGYNNTKLNELLKLYNSVDELSEDERKTSEACNQLLDEIEKLWFELRD
jgi:hypothetical protein